MAVSDNKLIKAVRRFSTTIGAGGIANDSATTVPLSSVPAVFSNGDAIEFIVDRVSTTGTLTTDKEETIVGEVSGSNVINCARGVEGTAQAHSAGAVVEIKLTADMWNRMVDWGLVEHSQDGTHDATKVAMLAGTQTFTGAKTFDTAITSKQIATPANPASGYNKIYFKSDNKAYTLTSAGVEKALSPIPRTTTETSSATPTINTDNTDIHTITALAAAITSMTTNLSGTPVNGQKLIVRIKDNGTARAITWGASFASRGATLPTTTVANKTMYVGLIYNSTASTWDCVAVVTEA